MKSGFKFLSVFFLAFFLFGELPGHADVELRPYDSTQSQWKGGRYPDTTYEGITYVSSEFLEQLFGHEGAWVPDRQKFVVADRKGKKWFFTVDNPFMNVGDAVYNLGFPVRRGPEFLFLPVPSLLRILALHKIQIKVDPASMTIEENDSKTIPEIPNRLEGSNIMDVVVDNKDNGTVVSIKTIQELEMERFWVPPNFIVRLQKGKFHPDFPVKIKGEQKGKGWVKQILSTQEKDVAQITLTITKPIDTVDIEYSQEFQGYQIMVHKKTKEKEPIKAKTSAVIIIDPGHGGKDPGAVVGGESEAKITLAVGKALQTILVKLGYKAILTRETDEFISLADRPKFASSQGGDLFISLHCNSIGGSTKHKNSVSGFTAYILREGESEEDKALARRENEAVSEESGKHNKSEISPVDWILLEHQLNLYSKESESFVGQIVKSFDGFKIAKYSTGASQAGFYVLVGAYMPAVLFEMGFLTHDEDRKILASERGQKQIADRLAQAIHKYRNSLNSKSNGNESKKLNSK